MELFRLGRQGGEELRNAGSFIFTQMEGIHVFQLIQKTLSNILSYGKKSSLELVTETDSQVMSHKVDYAGMSYIVLT